MRLLLSTLILLITCSGCSYFQSTETNELGYRATDSNQKDMSAGTTTDATTNDQASLSSQEKGSPAVNSDVEVFWSGDKSGVDGFLLEYGYDRENLSLQKRIPQADLQMVQDPEYGEVFKALLPSVENNKEVFVVIRAYKGEFLSPASEPISIPPLSLPQ